MLPRLAIVSLGIRRDLLAPMRYFRRFEIFHLYRKSEYGDLTAEDMDATLHPYTSPPDLYRQLASAQPHVIQGVEPYSLYTQPYLWACLLAAGKTRAALLASTHENRPLDLKFGMVRAAYLRRALKPYFARACRIIIHNNGGRENVLECGGAPDKIVRGMWGNWGVDTHEFVPRAAAPATDPRHGQTILFVGRLVHEKGVFVLLDAFEQVRQSQPNARLLYVGDGAARAGLERIVQEHGLVDVVEFWGIVKHRALPEVFQGADVFCAPSLTTRKWAEQVGATNLQAMACGVPVVSTRSGSIPEYVPDGVAGTLVPENDAVALAAALCDLLNNPGIARAMGERGRAFACAHYDAQTNVERGEQLILEHCLAGRV